MTQRIDHITPEQSARFSEWADKWIKIGLSTDPADFDAATEAALRAYALCNLTRPKVVLRMSSPYGATLGGAIAWAMLRELKVAGVKSQVWSQVGSQVESQVWSQVRSQVWSQVRLQVGSGVNNSMSGSLWASWVAYISFIRDVLGWRGSTLDRFEIDETLVKSCGWVWWHEDVLAISDRPELIRRDERGRLHCADGPSMLYRDGWSIWSWHGISIPEHIIMAPDAITPAMIDGETNSEVRRVMIERYGYERYVRRSKVVHEDAAGKLRKRRNKRGDEIAVVEVINGTAEPDGTFKRYFLSVPPELKTATEAVAWTYAMTAEQYSALKVRT